MNKRKIISIVLKSLAVFMSLGGVILCCVCAEQDGYSNWSKRLLYFTNLSNIWIGVLFIFLLCLPLIKKGNEKWEKVLYVLKYIFTVSITITGFTFCCLLAPFAKNDGYDAWTVSSFMTHVFAPIFSIVDYFVDEKQICLTYKCSLLSTLPPLAYLIFASILHYANVDFGRGDTYPYFFLNHSSPVKIFGVGGEPPFVIGSFYWIVLFLLMVLTFGFVYLYFHPSNIQKRREKKALKFSGDNQDKSVENE